MHGIIYSISNLFYRIQQKLKTYHKREFVFFQMLIRKSICKFEFLKTKHTVDFETIVRQRNNCGFFKKLNKRHFFNGMK